MDNKENWKLVYSILEMKINQIKNIKQQLNHIENNLKDILENMVLKVVEEVKNMINRTFKIVFDEEIIKEVENG